MWRWLARISVGLLLRVLGAMVFALVVIIGVVAWIRFWYGPY